MPAGAESMESRAARQAEADFRRMLEQSGRAEATDPADQTDSTAKSGARTSGTDTS